MEIGAFLSHPPGAIYVTAPAQNQAFKARIVF
jgi:hypothetical protein